MRRYKNRYYYNNNYYNNYCDYYHYYNFNTTNNITDALLSKRAIIDDVLLQEVNLTLVEQLVKKYRVVLEKPLQQGQGRDLYALADKWVTEKGILPEYAPELGKLHR